MTGTLPPAIRAGLEQDIESEFFEQAIVNNPGEAINLDSDDENDLMPPPPARTVPLPSIALSDDDLFVPETSPAPSISLQRTREVQAKFAQEMRRRLLLKAVTAGSTTSDVAASGRDDDSETSVVVRRKGDEESRAFARINAVNTRKKNAGTISLEHEVEYMKANATEQQRIHKAIADEEWARGASEDEVASITETVRDHFLAPRPADGTSDDDDVPETSVKGRSRERMADDYGPAPKRARKTTAAKAAATGDGRKKKTPAAKGKAPKAKAGQRMMNMSSIMGTDVFGDTAATANLRNQPTVGGSIVPRARDKALTQLIASVPIEDKKEVGADKKLLMRAIQDFDGKYSVKASAEGDGNWNVVGMKSSLKHYQACVPSTSVLGTAFMRRRERALEQPKGGILADEMGLGKTVMMLANIVNGKPKKGAERRATLIVASPSLVAQLAHEIGKHTEGDRENKDHGVNWIQNHASARLKCSNNIAEMASKDIVLTTYGEICKSYPKAKYSPELVTSKSKDEWWAIEFEKEKGDLHRVLWFRVVLDEAQAIKNHKSHTSNACRALESTPVQNTIAEFYPYLKFIREPTTGSYRIFKENCCTPSDPEGIERLQVYLEKCMLEFNGVERQIYEIIKKRFVERINTISDSGALHRRSSHLWTMILRLRQLCGHILLVQGPICDLLQREDFEKLNSITENEEEGSDEGANLLIHLRNILKSNTSVKTIQVETVPMDLIDPENPTLSTGGTHGLDFTMKKYLEDLQKSEQFSVIAQRTQCSGCRQEPDDPQVTSCFHIYCKTCMVALQHAAARRGRDEARCVECNEVYATYQPCGGLDAFDEAKSTTRGSTAPTPAKTKKRSKKDAAEEVTDWISMKGPILPSAKTQATKAQILNWIAEDKSVKIVIFTQFLPMVIGTYPDMGHTLTALPIVSQIRILKKMCKTEDWSHCEYTGKMSQDSKDQSINEFSGDKQILLASLRSGGLGLNLMMASKVICLDPCIEQQAFCRVFRITKPTSFVKFMVRNTIDAAMMAMKERKQIEIDEVIDVTKRRDLNVKDLLRLFGHEVRNDGEGNPFIYAEADGHKDEHLRLPNHDMQDEMQVRGNEA
ncbi:hypothetical protein LTR17_013947 [Elasticomyces elasticus]|nr:hypothetical protein LTR17_013947 [Elasticomyces elasticus]